MEEKLSSHSRSFVIVWHETHRPLAGEREEREARGAARLILFLFLALPGGWRTRHRTTVTTTGMARRRFSATYLSTPEGPRWG